MTGTSEDSVSPMRGHTAVVHGHRGVPRMFKDFHDSFSESRVDLSEVHAEGDRVVAFGRIRTRGKESGAETDFPLVIVVGHPEYYPRFGFELADALGLEAPFEVPSEAWMAYRLPAYSPAARGSVVYPQAFAEVT